MTAGIFQPVSMPVTPLARGMWRYGGLPAESYLSDPPRQQDMGPAIVAAVVEKRMCVDPVAHTAAPNFGAQPVCIAKYASHDPVTGRVWGVPNAGGRGQCVDCPNRCAPPSNRCVDCQIRFAQMRYTPMSADELGSFQAALAPLLDALPGKQQLDRERLGHLYTILQEGRLSPACQTEILAIAQAIRGNDKVSADRLLAGLVKQHWEHHKEWLAALKRLLCRM